MVNSVYSSVLSKLEPQRKYDCLIGQDRYRYFRVAIYVHVHMPPIYHDVRLITRSVSVSKATLHSLSGSSCRTSLALSAYERARSRVRSTPADLRTKSLACVPHEHRQIWKADDSEPTH